MSNNEGRVRYCPIHAAKAEWGGRGFGWFCPHSTSSCPKGSRDVGLRGRWRWRHATNPRNVPTAVRFWSKVKKTKGCWIWTGFLFKGYGRFKPNGKQTSAHRMAYELSHNVKIPQSLTIDHLCRNRACVNPEHLEIVSLKVNVLRGESPSANNARKRFCLRGHRFSGKNLIIIGKKRRCRTCSNMRTRKWRQRKSTGQLLSK